MKRVTDMKISELHVNDTESFIKLNKKIDDSGYMLYDPGERQIRADKQKKSDNEDQLDGRIYI